jgi:hypothetical protein
MNTDETLQPHPAEPVRKRSARAEARKRRFRRARTFFIIAAMATIVSVAGHCLPGDNPAPDTAANTTITSGQ